MDQDQLNPGKGMIIDGVLASEAIDSSGEIIDIKGADISSLTVDGTLNTEHKNPDDKDSNWSVVIGRCIKAKKIFGPDDCENDRERFFWDLVGLPFIYGQFRLFDGAGHSEAKNAAAIIRDALHAGEPPIVNFSIEGSTLQKEGNVIKRSIARRVAATLKPCNKTAASGVLEDPNGPPLPSQKKQKDILEEIAEDAKKFESNQGLHRLGGHAGQYHPSVNDSSLMLNQVERAVSVLRDINKTMTAGMPSGAPGGRTGGAALQREDWGKVKGRAMSAVRDFDPAVHKNFREFLKFRLPEASDSFLDRFSDLVGDLKLKSSITKKAETLLAAIRLAKAKVEEPAASGPVRFAGKLVEPGEIEVLRGEHAGKKGKLLHSDGDFHYAVMEGAPAPVKLRSSSLDSGFKVNKLHREVPTKTVFAAKHGIAGLFEHPDQQALLDGLDLDKPVNRPKWHDPGVNDNAPTSGWFKSGSGLVGYVKPHTQSDDTDGNWTSHEDLMSHPRREAAFYTLARDVFGLGHHVPTTAAFRRPDNGDEHSVMALVNGNHHHHADELPAGLQKDHDQNGTLDKLMMMDMIMGNRDRHGGNYLVNQKAPYIHLIDNGFSLFNGRNHTIPWYVQNAHDLIHPAAHDWALKLDPVAFQSRMKELGVPHELAGPAVARMVLLQRRLQRGSASKRQAWFSHAVS